MYIHTVERILKESRQCLVFFCISDAERQKIMSTLSKKKDRLSQTILMYRDIFDTNQQLISEMKCKKCIHFVASTYVHL